MISLRDQIQSMDGNSDVLVRTYKDIKSRTTQGKLRTNDNHAYINNSHVITAAGRFVTPEEQMANLDLWVIVKDNDIVESLHILKNVYKREAMKMSRLCSLLVFVIFVLLIIICCMWMYT